MKIYNNYYFFSLRYNNSESRGYHRYFIEKNVDFDDFQDLELQKKELIKLNEEAMNLTPENKEEIFFDLVMILCNKYKDIYNELIFLNKEINKDYKIFISNLERLKHKIKMNPDNILSYSGEILRFQRRLLSNNIKSLEDYIAVGNLFLSKEREDPLIFFDSYIANHDIRTVEFNIEKDYLPNAKQNTIFFVEISNYFRTIYIPSYELKLSELQDKFVETFYSFNNKKTWEILLLIDDLFMQKKKLQLEEQLFYSLASNFLITLIERFKDTLKNIKKKILILKKFISLNVINKADKEKYKEYLDWYSSELLVQNMVKFLSIKVHDFEDYLKGYRLNKELKSLTLSFDIFSLIYKDVQNYEEEMKLIIFSSENGVLNKEQNRVLLMEKYKVGENSYNLSMGLDTAYLKEGYLKNIVIRREFDSHVFTQKQYKNKTPFNVQFNYIKNFYIF